MGWHDEINRSFFVRLFQHNNKFTKSRGTFVVPPSQRASLADPPPEALISSSQKYLSISLERRTYAQQLARTRAFHHSNSSTILSFIIGRTEKSNAMCRKMQRKNTHHYTLMFASMSNLIFLFIGQSMSGLISRKKIKYTRSRRSRNL